jgi:transcriptional regulator with XRE-family HTH domain
MKKFDSEKFAARLRQHHWTVTQFAERTGVSRQVASLWYAGTCEPGVESLQRIARAFGLKTIEPLLSEVSVTKLLKDNKEAQKC